MVNVVTDLGADNTGSTNVLSLIKDAIEHPTDSEIYFPSGTYCVEATFVPGTPEGLIRVPSGLTIRGDGFTSRISCVASRPSGDPVLAWLFLLDGVADVTIRDLALESTGNAGDAFDNGIEVRAYKRPTRHVAVRHCELSKFRKSAISSHVSRRPDHSAQLTDICVVDCTIHTVGRMIADPGICFGIGINVNGWDGAYLARNSIYNIGINNTHWGIYCPETRFATVAENEIKDCSGGIAWTSVAADPGFDALSIIRNQIDLTRDPATVNPTEAPIVGDRIGVQLRGDGSNVPIQVGVIGNCLTMANIRASAQHAVISGNIVNLADLHNTPGIWVGLYGYDSPHVLVNDNDIVANAPADVPSSVVNSTGILVSNGTAVQVRNNRISGTSFGIALGVDHVQGASGVVSHAAVEHNEIQVRDKGRFVHINGAVDVQVRDNSFRCEGGVARGVQVGDTQVKGDNRAVVIANNQFAGLSGWAFGMAAPQPDAVLPRDIHFVGNTSNIAIVDWPPNCPAGASYKYFVDGDVVQGNDVTAAFVDAVTDNPSPCVQSGLLHGAANVIRRLLAHDRKGQRAYSVLGGHIFTAPLPTPCRWSNVLHDPWEHCAEGGSDSATNITWLTNGFPFQVIEIRAVGGGVTIYDQTDVPVGTLGNVHLVGAKHWDMKDGDILHLQCHADLQWYEFDRIDTP